VLLKLKSPQQKYIEIYLMNGISSMYEGEMDLTDYFNLEGPSFPINHHSST
jgi:hypothetical protein